MIGRVDCFFVLVVVWCGGVVFVRCYVFFVLGIELCLDFLLCLF